jgi:hypothetical protein
MRCRLSGGWGRERITSGHLFCSKSELFSQRISSMDTVLYGMPNLLTPLGDFDAALFFDAPSKRSSDLLHSGARSSAPFFANQMSG